MNIYLNYGWNDYLLSIKKPIVQPRFQLFLLHKDETIAEDLSKYMLQNGDSSSPSLTITLQDGIRRQATICLSNDDNTLIPSPIGKIWVNTKFLLRIGINIEIGNNNSAYWFPAGVFVLKNPTNTHNYSSKTITLDLVDKYSLLDGTVSGNLDADYEINRGSSVADAIKQILTSVSDPQEPLIDNSFKDVTLPGNIAQELGNKFSDLITDVTNLVSASYFYDASGRFNVVKGERSLDDTIKSSIWDFSTEDNIYGECTVTYNMNAFFNKVVVVGNNIANNGTNVQAIAINKNPLSDSNINLIGTRTAPPINDNSISTKAQAQELANYNLDKYNILNKSYQFYTNYIPSINDVNQICRVTDNELNLYKQRMLIKEIQIPLVVSSRPNINCSNTNELSFSIG